MNPDDCCDLNPDPGHPRSVAAASSFCQRRRRTGRPRCHVLCGERRAQTIGDRSLVPARSPPLLPSRRPRATIAPSPRRPRAAPRAATPAVPRPGRARLRPLCPPASVPRPGPPPSLVPARLRPSSPALTPSPPHSLSPFSVATVACRSAPSESLPAARPLSLPRGPSCSLCWTDHACTTSSLRLAGFTCFRYDSHLYATYFNRGHFQLSTSCCTRSFGNFRRQGGYCYAVPGCFLCWAPFGLVGPCGAGRTASSVR